MATYEYRCQNCRKKFERVEPMAEHGTKSVRCPKCRSTRVVQQIGNVFAKTSRKS